MVDDGIETVLGGGASETEQPVIRIESAKNEVLAPRNKKGYMIGNHLFLRWPELTAAGKEHATV